ncbi:MAG: cobalamin biosynthesis protein CbiA [Pseudomonadota bacterium]
MNIRIDLKGIVIIVGNYGSGKTEVSINLAVNQKQQGMAVRVADLDLVNFYFRTREALKFLTDLGIELVLPSAEYLNADLPILTPAVAGMIRQPTGLTLLDVGGDDAGATVLSALADAFAGQSFRMLQVVNPFRPNTDSIAGCGKIRKEIEAASGMTINGIIGNANLIEETTVETIGEGYDFVSALSVETGLPLEFITAEKRFLPKMELTTIKCPVLAIDRQLSPPWIRK